MTHAVGPDPEEIRGPPVAVGGLIEGKPGPCEAGDHLGAGRRVVLADPGREDEPVDAAERRDERSDFARDAIDEQVDGALASAFVAAFDRRTRMSFERPETPSSPDLV